MCGESTVHFLLRKVINERMFPFREALPLRVDDPAATYIVGECA
jgi:hypothetical protein